jgi:DNA-binding response OmpR family regulator
METSTTDKKFILIVDDDPDIRLFLEFGLQKAGFGVLQASNGAKALDILKERMPDLIITDAMMPVLDGYGLIQALKNDEAWNHIPVIFLTGKDGEKGQAEAIPAVELMKKPFATADILARINRLLMMV